MVYTIENEYLSVSAETLGAQLSSIRSKRTGTEYLWQGDPAYWAGRAYNLFPIVGRLYDDKYEYDGKIYEMKPHGFARKTEFTLCEKSRSEMVFAISSTDETKKQYPFDFIFRIRYSVALNRLTVTYEVKNVGNNKMYFGLGGHPGFNVPFDGGSFEDYFLRFGDRCEPRLLGLGNNVLMSGDETDYPLENGNVLPLKHDLFSFDALVFKGACRRLEICGRHTKRSVSVDFPGMKYLGIWHKPCTDAPYVCIEPWETLPSYEGKIEKLNEKDGVGVVGAGETYYSPIAITVNEEE